MPCLAVTEGRRGPIIMTAAVDKSLVSIVQRDGIAVLSVDNPPVVGTLESWQYGYFALFGSKKTSWEVCL
jgi:hypothetical protein